jgi:hypothetical protein
VPDPPCFGELKTDAAYTCVFLWFILLVRKFGLVYNTINFLKSAGKLACEIRNALARVIGPFIDPVSVKSRLPPGKGRYLSRLSEGAKTVWRVTYGIMSLNDSA